MARKKKVYYSTPSISKNKQKAKRRKKKGRLAGSKSRMNQNKKLNDEIKELVLTYIVTDIIFGLDEVIKVEAK